MIDPLIFPWMDCVTFATKEDCQKAYKLFTEMQSEIDAFAAAARKVVDNSCDELAHDAGRRELAALLKAKV